MSYFFFFAVIFIVFRHRFYVNLLKLLKIKNSVVMYDCAHNNVRNQSTYNICNSTKTKLGLETTKLNIMKSISSWT